MRINEVKVSFLNSNKKYSFCDNNVNTNINDLVVVETVNGLELAKVVTKINTIDLPNDLEIKNVVQKATDEDIAKYEKNKLTSKQVKKKVQSLANEANLDMKVISVEINLNSNKYLINFISENRVDFRELVKNIAALYKVKIELRQVGSRDETKIIGGLGPCGRPCCCKLFLEEFEHSTIKMAKVQGLSLNPTKISGLCGRLMCCLAYENEHYSETFKDMPRINSEVITKDGKGLAIYNNILNKTVSVKFGNKENNNEEIREYPLSELKVLRKNVVETHNEDKNE